MRRLQRDNLMNWMKNVIPPLESNKYKGQSGKICIIGGSKEYTGAPYFSAISALLCGADLVHVICPSEAAPVIKSYSPELIVHPILNANGILECQKWIDKMHAVVIGPGLGRDNTEISIQLMKHICARNIPIVIDADGLQIIANQPNVIAGYRKAILTPNINEARVLYEKIISAGESFNVDFGSCSRLATALGHLTICAKGPTDIITDGYFESSCDTIGSLRRCGGQGDLLSGTLGVLSSWCYGSNLFTEHNDNLGCQSMTAAYGACSLTRTCSRLAFVDKQRSMITTDMIKMIGQSFIETFPPRDN